MSRLAPIGEVRISGSFDEEWAEKNEAAIITPTNLEQLLTTGKPVAPDDELIDAWHYSYWYTGTFVSGGRKWSMVLYLGGLGVIADDVGHKGAFKFGVPPGDGS